MSGKGKIFEVGVGKTGTHSLTKALSMVGVRALHYQRIHPAIKQFKDGKKKILFQKLLEEYDALLDGPREVYAELWEQYPEARFILPVRSPDTRLTSRENHEWLKSTKGYNNKIVKNGGEVTDTLRLEWSLEYLMHDYNVRKFFRGKTELLVIDVVGGEGWEILCPFLGVSIPDKPFPHSYKTLGIMGSIPPDKFPGGSIPGSLKGAD